MSGLLKRKSNRLNMAGRKEVGVNGYNKKYYQHAR